MRGDLRRAFSGRNMQLALGRLQRNSERYYKNHFRHIYKAYAVASDDALADLAKRLRADAHECSHTTKFYLPKASLIQRPMSLMTVEDQITYQAMGNVIGDALYPVMRPRYYNVAFGNLYSGPGELFCFRDWRLAHRRFTRRIVDLYNEGYVWTATFDLTACYDSIDHGVLLHFLRDLGLDEEFCRRLANYLRTWTVSRPECPIYQEHGIPQGPMTSGILSECVLRQFDVSAAAQADGVRYLRYVDDIRLMARSEATLREQIVELDMCSKEIGLFPQSSKIHVHEIEEIHREIKTISVPDVPLIRREGELDPEAATLAIARLSRNKTIESGDESAFKYWLPALPRLARHALRLLELLEKYPHLANSIASWLGGFKKLPRSVSLECLAVIGRQSMYGGLVADLLRAVNTKIHPDCRDELIGLCEALSGFGAYDRDPAMREAVKGVLVNALGLAWRDRRLLIVSERDWWVKSRVLADLNPESVSREGAYERLLNSLAGSASCDVAIVAAETIGARGLAVTLGRHEIPNLPAQLVLRNQGLIGRVRNNRCLVTDAMRAVLGEGMDAIDWRRLLGPSYDTFMSKSMRWRSYSSADPTAWVNYTDTMNDLLLAALGRIEPNLAQYSQGRIGRFTSGVARGTNARFVAFAAACPDFHDFVVRIHDMRLVSDLSHPVDWGTGAPTRPIEHKEVRRLLPAMKTAYLAAWTHAEPML